MDSYSYSRRDYRESSNPSFSSTLLDAMYRSIDENDEKLVIYRETMKKKLQVNRKVRFKDEEEMANFQRVCMIEKWMEKKESQSQKSSVITRRRSLADFLPGADKDRNPEVLFSNSSWSSSDSSNGFTTSSEFSSSSCYFLQKPKAIRTNTVSVQQEKTNEGRFVKTKSRALKIYGDLKKVKQPISPGGKLATFLNSLFTPGNQKKGKIATNSTNASTCSSSRSCLSKTPSSRGKSSTGMKRSVRFYPVSIIVDEDCQPCGHKTLHEEKPRIEEAAKDFLRSYQKRVELECNSRIAIDEDEDDDDDCASYASSDLFELDNLSAIGMARYREELPVYETTHLDTNRAIASGMIL